MSQKRDHRLNARQINGSFFHRGGRLRTSIWKPKNDEQAPLRSELFSKEQMRQHGKSLAALHSVHLGHAPDRLLARLADNERILNETCHLLTAATQANRPIAPAGEWVLDNFYLIEQQIRTARRHLPKGYSQVLPRLLKVHPQDCPAFTIWPWKRSRTLMHALIWRVSAALSRL